MSKASIRSRCAEVLVASLALAGPAAAASPGLEYRFKALDGVDFKWRDGKVEKLNVASASMSYCDSIIK